MLFHSFPLRTGKVINCGSSFAYSISFLIYLTNFRMRLIPGTVIARMVLSKTTLGFLRRIGILCAVLTCSCIDSVTMFRVMGSRLLARFFWVLRIASSAIGTSLGTQLFSMRFSILRFDCPYVVWMCFRPGTICRIACFFMLLIRLPMLFLYFFTVGLISSIAFQADFFTIGSPPLTVLGAPFFLMGISVFLGLCKKGFSVGRIVACIVCADRFLMRVTIGFALRRMVTCPLALILSMSFQLFRGLRTFRWHETNLRLLVPVRWIRQLAGNELLGLQSLAVPPEYSRKVGRIAI